MDHSTPTVLVQIQGVKRNLILDSGSCCSILQPGVVDEPLGCTEFAPFGVTGKNLEVQGEQTINFLLGNVMFNHTFVVCKLPTNAAGILGINFLLPRRAKLDLEAETLTLYKGPNFKLASGVQQDSLEDSYGRSKGNEMAILTALSDCEPKDSHVDAKRCKGELKEILAGKVSPRKREMPVEIVLEESEAWLVRSKESVTLQPRCRQVICGILDSRKQSFPMGSLCVEPAQIPIEGVCAARVLTRISTGGPPDQLTEAKVGAGRDYGTGHKMRATPDFRVGGSKSDESREVYTSDAVMLMVANFSEESLTLPKGTVIGIAQEISENLVVPTSSEEETEVGRDHLFLAAKNKEIPAKFKAYVRGRLAHLSPEDREVLEPVLYRYAHVFHDEEKNDFKGTDLVQHRIETGDAMPIRKAPYRIPFALRREVDNQIQDMLKKGVISESNSPWSAPVVLVPKKSADGKPKYRFCVDYRALNAVTKFDSYPLPRFEETTSTLAGSKFFTVLDAFSGFWQISIYEPHRQKIGFSVPGGHFEFNRLPYGISNSPASFQRLMDNVLRNLIGPECWIFIDDLLIFSNTIEEHARRISNVLERFEKANLQLQPTKCVFAQKEVSYLGYTLSSRGILSSPEKVKAVQEYPIPKNVKDVRAFLGLCSFYRRLVPKFADIAKPLTQLTRKDVDFEWNQDCQEAFEKLKSKLSNTPVLAYPDFTLPFILTTDASKIGLGAVLSQVQNGVERPIACE